MEIGAASEYKLVPGGAGAPGSGTKGFAEDEIARRIEARKAARARKDFAEADRIRRSWRRPACSSRTARPAPRGNTANDPCLFAPKAMRGFLGSGVWSGGKDCVERNRSERAKVASVASEEAPASRGAAPGYIGKLLPGGTLKWRRISDWSRRSPLGGPARAIANSPRARPRPPRQVLLGVTGSGRRTRWHPSSPPPAGPRW